MTPNLEIPAELKRLPPALIQGLISLGERQADLAAAFLLQAGILPPLKRKSRRSKPAAVGISREPLRELGLVLLLQEWADCGLWPGTNPQAEVGDIRAMFVIRWLAGPEAVGDAFSRWLGQVVIGIFLTRVCWQGREMLDADFLLAVAGDNDFLDQIVGLLWDLRNLADDEEGRR